LPPEQQVGSSNLSGRTRSSCLDSLDYPFRSISGNAGFGRNWEHNSFHFTGRLPLRFRHRRSSSADAVSTGLEHHLILRAVVDARIRATPSTAAMAVGRRPASLDTTDRGMITGSTPHGLRRRLTDQGLYPQRPKAYFFRSEKRRFALRRVYVGVSVAHPTLVP
jgi:hypothetical protein